MRSRGACLLCPYISPTANGSFPVAGTYTGFDDHAVFEWPRAAATLLAVAAIGVTGLLWACGDGVTTPGGGSRLNLVFAVSPQDGIAGRFLRPVVQVQLVDRNGRLVTNVAPTVFLSLANGSGNVLAEVDNQPIRNGVALFDGLAVTSPGSSYTLIATASGVGTATSTPFHIVSSAGGPGEDDTPFGTSHQVPVATVDVTPATAAIQPGAEVELSAVPRDSSGNFVPRGIFWSSSDSSIATVVKGPPGTGTAQVTGMADGVATITATSGGVDGTVEITVVAPVASVVVTPEADTVIKGATRQLTAEPRDANDNSLTGRDVTWATSDPALATVDATGLVTGIRPGTVTITATSEGVDGTATITVIRVPVASVDVSPDSGLIYVGAELELTGIPRDSGGNAVSRALFWASSDEAVATVVKGPPRTASATVTGVAEGTATITATSDGVVGSATVVVEAVPVTSVVVTPDTATVLLNSTLALTAEPRDSAGNPLQRPVSWATNDAAIATVDGAGVVTGMADGIVTITATSDGVDGTAEITVFAPVASVVVTPEVDTVIKGTTRQLTAEPRDANDNPLVGRDVTWATSDPALATVDATGLVTGIRRGTITITATSEGIDGTATVTVIRVPVASVDVTPDSGLISVGAELELTGIPRDSVGNSVSRALFWASSDEAVATVVKGPPRTASATVTGVAEGTATITATSDGVVGSATVVVEEVPVTSVVVTPDTATVLLNSTLALTAEPRDSAGNPLQRLVSWATNDAAIATVDGAGVVTGMADGVVTITATSDGIDGTAAITVFAPVASVVVMPAVDTVIEGATRQLTAEPRDANDTPLTGRDVTWATSDPGRATVDATGLVTGESVGDVTITATSEGVSGESSVAVVPVPVASVVVMPDTATVWMDSSLGLTAEPRDSADNPLARAVTWATGDPAIATVDGAGVVTGVADGAVTITATSEGVDGTAGITVFAPVASVVVTPDVDTVIEGTTRQLTAEPRDANDNPLVGRDVAWATSDTTIATVNAAGGVTGVRRGSVVVTATSEGVDGTAAVTVIRVPVASVDVTPDSGLVYIGTDLELTGVPLDSAGNAVARGVFWASSNEAVATVTKGPPGTGTAIVSGVAEGTATITATSDGVMGTANITVETVPVASIVVTPTVDTIVENQTVQISAEPRDSADNPLPGRVVTWTSSDPAVATVDGDGLVTGLTVGTVTITATSEGVEGTSTITVDPAPVAQVIVTPTSATIGIARVVPLKADVEDPSGNPLVRSVTWSSSDPSVASVSPEGVVFAADVGVCTITAESEGVQGTATITVQAGAALPAFPGAEGFGAYAMGGRGGAVIHVTNLNDAGPGSFRDAVTQPGPRTVVFDVSGTIALQSDIRIRDDSLTIAGQTAPGDGVTIKGATTFIEANHVVVRFIRFRRGSEDIDSRQTDAVTVADGTQIILDHVSVSWGTDESLSVTRDVTNLTLQWSIISEGLDTLDHGFGSIIRSGMPMSEISLHHNLWAHHRARLPNLTSNPGAASTHLVDFRNNVRYNWERGYGDTGHPDAPNDALNINWVGNYSQSGPSVFPDHEVAALTLDSETTVSLYVNDNLSNGTDVGTDTLAFDGPFVFSPTPFAVAAGYEIATESPSTAYSRVLNEAGATVPFRDPVDDRVIVDVQNLTGTFIKSENDVGGWPVLNTAPPPTDTDQDGMPDDWETARGLDPLDPSDRNGDRNGLGNYTNLEEYLDWLVTSN